LPHALQKIRSGNLSYTKISKIMADTYGSLKEPLSTDMAHILQRGLHMNFRKRNATGKIAGCLTGFAITLSFTGCTTIQTTTPARSATEQLLLSTSVDRALADVDLSIFANRKVYLDTTYFDSYDPKYAIGTIRDALSREGALLMDTAAASDVIIEARSGGLSIDNAETLVGIPTMGVPIPFAGAIQIPEMAFYKSDRQHGFAKVALLAFVRVSREHIYSSGDLDGKSYSKYYKLLGSSWARTDIPEKHKACDKEKYETWFPQYDREALTTSVSSNSIPASTNTVAATNSPSIKSSDTNKPPVSPVSATNAPPTHVTNTVTN